MTIFHTQEYPDGPHGKALVTSTTDRRQAIQNTIDAMARAEQRLRQARAEDSGDADPSAA
jgi:hypothetical protein